MALTRTSLSAACTASDKRLAITSTSTGFPGVGILGTRQLLQVDGEYMLIDQVVSSGVVDVAMRGYNGTTATAHAILAGVTTSSSALDFFGVPVGAVDSRPPYVDDIVTYGASGAIAIPTKNTTIEISKATVAAMTIVAPAADQDGLRLTITSVTGTAHTVTGVALLADGVTGSPHSTATYAAAVGASMTLEACNSLWNVIALQGVTVA